MHHHAPGSLLLCSVCAVLGPRSGNMGRRKPAALLMVHPLRQGLGCCTGAHDALKSGSKASPLRGASHLAPEPRVHAGIQGCHCCRQRILPPGAVKRCAKWGAVCGQYGHLVCAGNEWNGAFHVRQSRLSHWIQFAQRQGERMRGGEKQGRMNSGDDQRVVLKPSRNEKASASHAYGTFKICDKIPTTHRLTWSQVDPSLLIL